MTSYLFQVYLNDFFEGEEVELVLSYWKQEYIPKHEKDILRIGYGSWLKYKHPEYFEHCMQQHKELRYHINGKYLFDEWVWRETVKLKQKLRKQRLKNEL